MNEQDSASCLTEKLEEIIRYLLLILQEKNEHGFYIEQCADQPDNCAPGGR
jgi:hypothetical protein